MEFNSESRRETTGSGASVVGVVGEHDMATVEALRAELEKALATSGGLVVDLSEATFVDSSVIRALVDARRVLEARGQQLVIQIDTASRVRRTLELTGLAQAVAIVSDRDEALLLATRKAGT